MTDRYNQENEFRIMLFHNQYIVSHPITQKELPRRNLKSTSSREYYLEDHVLWCFGRNGAAALSEYVSAAWDAKATASRQVKRIAKCARCAEPLGVAKERTARFKPLSRKRG